MKKEKSFDWRIYFLSTLFTFLLLGLICRFFDLAIFNRNFLLKQSDARIIRTVNTPAYRGMILDRLGSPLAITTPVDSVWVNPQILNLNNPQLTQLAKLLNISLVEINRHIHKANSRSFLYLKRQISPDLAEKIQELKIPGIYLQREYKRFYPQAEVTAHVVGLTNIDDHGQEGLELSYEHWLSGKPGKKEVMKDRVGHIISEVALLRPSQPGRNLNLSLDHRIQYSAYQTLKETVEQYNAVGGSVVVLDVLTGEILAMVNQPSYNPNNRAHANSANVRNRAMTDMFEPGSTLKPFTIALALASGRYSPSSVIETSPGQLKVGGYTIQDDGFNYGRLDLAGILQKSSNIGAAKIMLSLSPKSHWELLHRFGFGQRTETGFPGEANGFLSTHNKWYPSVVATMAYGYGISVTTLQLAHAYSSLANGGISKPVLFLKADAQASREGVRVLSSKISHKVVEMLEKVVEQGTGRRAKIPGYRVAGKTGTAFIAGPNGYDKNRNMSSFVGIAPVSKPRLVVAVVIREPKGETHGAIVAAPAFAKIMSESLRLLNIPPDKRVN